jgi:cell division septal protein FtsQ
MTPARRDSGRRTSPVTRARPPSALRPGARPGGTGRRTRPVRRASAGLTPTRAAALLALLLGLAGLYGAVSSGAFIVRHIDTTGLTWTSEASLVAALDVPGDQNLFTLHTADLEERATSIPAIRGVRLTVALPDTIHVVADEREALLVWQTGTRRLLVDAEGLLFADLADVPADAVAALPVVDDQRFVAGSLVLGSTLDPVILDAARRLGSVRPADLGSAASGLAFRLDDDSGFVVRGTGVGWTAVFGFYTPTLRTTDLIPGQVRLLRALLAGREADVLRVTLADDRSGTYVPRGTVSPAASGTELP